MRVFGINQSSRESAACGLSHSIGLAVLAVVAGLAAGCASNESRLSGYTLEMPSQAAAGSLTGFAPCNFKGLKTRKGTAAECGTLVVAENRANPQGRKIALPVVKLPAFKPTDLEPIFFMTGGPGITNIAYDVEAPTLFENHDIYMLGFRGMDDLEPLDCPEVVEAIGLPNPLSEAVRLEIGKAISDCAERLTAKGVDLYQYGVVDVAYDLEDLRLALGLGKINMISNSYSSRVGQYYTRLYPESIKRSFIAAANPPGHFFWYPETTDEVLQAYSDLCAVDPVCSKETDDLAATVLGGLAKGDRKFIGMRVDMDRIRIGAFLLMMSRASAVNVFEASFEVEEDDAYFRYLFLSKIFKPMLAKGFMWGDVFSKGGVDCNLKGVNFVEERMPTATSIGSPFDVILDPGCDNWPNKPAPEGFDKAAIDQTETLIINGNLDIATPLKYVETELMPYLPNGHLVVLKDFGHDDWLTEQTPALDHLISGFFKDGTVDASRYEYSPVPFKAY